MRISDWSSDVCSSDLVAGDFLHRQEAVTVAAVLDEGGLERGLEAGDLALVDVRLGLFFRRLLDVDVVQGLAIDGRHAQLFCLRSVDQHAFHCCVPRALEPRRSEEHTDELQSLMRISYAVFCLKKKK